jgi:putative membrane protein
MKFVLRLLINAAALWVAIRIVSGVSFDGSWASLFFVALVFGVLNASVRPLLKLFTLPLLILTLGLFTFVINAVMLMLTSRVSDWLRLGFHVTGFGSAFLGALVVSLVSFLLSVFVREREMPRVHVHLGPHVSRMQD